MSTVLEANAATGGSPALPPLAPAAGRAVPKFHVLTVREVRRETPEAVSITFAVPADLAADFAFAPGQYLTLRTSIDGEEVRRSYSICSGPDDGELRVAVKQVESGVFSGWVNANLAAGDTIDVMTPTGRFGLEGDPGNGRIHVAFAAGSGITPVLSIARGVLSREPDSRFYLFYGNRTTTDILFRTELEELKDRFLGRLSVFHVLSREEQDLPVLNGHLNGEKVRLLLTAMVPAAAVDHAFVCGPTAMIDELEGTLKDLGLPPKRSMWNASSPLMAASRVPSPSSPRQRRPRMWPPSSSMASAATCRWRRARRSWTPRCGRAWTCPSPARAACAPPAAPRLSRARPRWTSIIRWKAGSWRRASSSPARPIPPARAWSSTSIRCRQTGHRRGAHMLRPCIQGAHPIRRRLP